MNKDKNDNTTRSILSTGAIARYCETSVTQVNRWINSGDLTAFRTPGGQYRITKKDFREFLERFNMPVKEDFFTEENSEKKVLIADDDASVVDAFSLLLTKHYDDIVVDVTYDGYEALVKTGEFKPDVLILDIKMPKINGLEVCRRLRENISSTRKIKIIAITAHPEAYDRETVLAHGADEYLVKPVESKILLETIEKLL